MIPIGQVLLEKKIITQAQLDAALQVQKVQPEKYLGEVLCEMGVPQIKIIKALYYSHKRKALGEILIDLEIINKDQLAKILSEQKRLRTQFGVRKPVGALLVELGFINMKNYMKALSIHFSMPVVSLEHFQISTEYQKAFGEKYTYHNKIVVVLNTPNIVKVAMAEPDFFVIEELEKALPFGKDIFFYLALPSEIEDCFQRKNDPFKSEPYK